MYAGQVEKCKHYIIELETQLQNLNSKASGLEEELSETANTLQDTLKTNEGLTNENEKLRKQFTALDAALDEAKRLIEEINVKLLKEQKACSLKENEYEEFIALLSGDLQLLQASLMKEWETLDYEKNDEKIIASLSRRLELCQY